MTTQQTEREKMEVLSTALMEYIDKKDLAGARKYVLDNLREFPEKIQAGILSGLVAEALDTAIASEEKTDLLQERGLASIEALENVLEKIKKETGGATS
jgi:hypothetical protein